MRSRSTDPGAGIAGRRTSSRIPKPVAAALRQVLAAGTSPRRLGLRMERGHVVSADDIRATGRTLLRLDVA